MACNENASQRPVCETSSRAQHPHCHTSAWWVDQVPRFPRCAPPVHGTTAKEGTPATLLCACIPAGQLSHAPFLSTVSSQPTPPLFLQRCGTLLPDPPQHPQQQPLHPPHLCLHLPLT